MGAMVYETADGEIAVSAGQAYYIPRGHLPSTRAEGCTVVELSPADELNATMEVVARNMDAAAGAGA